MIKHWYYSFIKTFRDVVLVAAVGFMVLEVISSVAYYQKQRSPVQSASSTISGLNWFYINHILPSNERKLDRILELRSEHVQAYPSYVFDPDMHGPGDYYHLANIPNTQTVLCESPNSRAEWITDEVGFRNPAGQLGGQVDYLFIGDSFAEGACQPENFTFGGLFRSQGKTVFNLGRGGTGPLFSYATLVEYGSAVRADTVLWFVFTGNDLHDLRSEKTTRLSAYMAQDYSQNLISRRSEVGDRLRVFLDQQITKKRGVLQAGVKMDKRPQTDLAGVYDSDAVLLERKALTSIARRINNKINKMQARLAVVIINHPRYRNFEIQRATSNSIKQFCVENGVPFLELSNEFLTKNWNDFYTPGDPHFNGVGYTEIGSAILNWADKSSPENRVILSAGDLE